MWGDWSWSATGASFGVIGKEQRPMAQPPETHFTIRPDVVKRLTAWMTGDGLKPSYDPVAFEPALKAALDAASAAYEQQFKKVFREQYDARRTV